jgi:hypothetical protein
MRPVAVVMAMEDVAVVPSAFLRVREDGVGFADLSEPFGGVWVLAIHVWVGFFREHVESFLEFCGRRGCGHVEDFIVGLGRGGGILGVDWTLGEGSG